MATTPTWQAATSGQAPMAGHANQFLGSHAAQILYAGAVQSSQTTAGTGSTTTNGLYLAQSFTTGSSQTTLGYVQMDLSSGGATSGNQLGPTTVSLQTSSSSHPSGTPLVSTTITAEYVSLAPTYITVPLPYTGLTASTQYWIVVNSAGNATYAYTWLTSNQTSGASTSTNGTTWSAQTYGFLYRVYDKTATGLRTASWDDSGARWTWTAYNTDNQISSYAEYTAGQTTAGYLQSFRSMSYTNGLLVGVS
jgi:hypothetical protein